MAANGTCSNRTPTPRRNARRTLRARSGGTCTGCAPFSASARLSEPDGTHYVGWFEPEHTFLEANAAFLARRFATRRWSILTPDASAHWDGKALRIGPGVDPGDVPDDDALEAYWRNLPDAAALPVTIRSASGWTEEIVEQDLRAPDKLPLGPVRTRSRESGPTARNTPLAHAAHEAETCRRCDLWEPATQTVFGEGPADARIMFVGEQPGDQEDVAGRPFVGPAGQLLDRALEEAGIDRRSVYVTNAVKHFKFVPRGKRRIHQKPESPEIAACKFWLDIELREVRPDLLVLLGATAARAMLGRTVTIGRERGRRIDLGDGQAGVRHGASVLPAARAGRGQPRARIPRVPGRSAQGGAACRGDRGRARRRIISRASASVGNTRQ